MAAKRAHVLIHGYVQGVGFRYFAREMAEGLGVVGWARNMSDGGVEVIAEGEEGRLARFIGELRAGPRRADVENVRVTWRDPTGEFNYFSIRR